MIHETPNSPEKKQQHTFERFIADLVANEPVNERGEQRLQLSLHVPGITEDLGIAASKKAEFVSVGKIYKQSESVLLRPGYFAEFVWSLDKALDRLSVLEYVSIFDDYFCKQRTFVLNSPNFRAVEIIGAYLDPEESIQDNIKRRIESPELRPAYDPERFDAMNRILQRLTEHSE